MQSIELNNMLEAARGRARRAAGLVSTTQAHLNHAISAKMIATSKKLQLQLKRQQAALNQANEEVREIETALSAEGDLVSQAQKPAKK